MPRRSPYVRALYAITVGLLASAACDCNDEVTPPCQSASPPAACGQDCSASPAACTSGTYCGPDGTCTADCVVDDGNCGAGQVCDPTDGRCIDDPNGGTGGGGGSDDGGVCQDLSVVADPVEPYVVLVVDRSGSMRSQYPANSGVSRWDAVRNVLVGTGGIVEQFQSVANFAVVQYTGEGTYSSGTADITSAEWPDLVETPAALDNLASILGDYSATDPESAWDTPTGESLWVTMCHLGLLDADGDGAADDRIGCDSFSTNTATPLDQQPWLDVADAPVGAGYLLPPVGAAAGQRNPNAKVVFVLATDGLPNTSVNPDADEAPTGAHAREARRWAIDAADEARKAGILTYVISVAGSDSLDLHLAHLACQGGTAPEPASDPFGGVADGETVCTNPSPASGPGLAHPSDSAELRQTLESIVTAEIPCEFQLDGSVNDVAAARDQGLVTVGGDSVTLDAVNGWYLENDGRTFTLNGTACQSFRDNPGAQLEATFPCGSGVILIPQ